MSTDVRTLKVLIVEDEFIIADEIATIVEAAGHAVVGPVGALDEALRALDRDPPDFAIIDASLRGTSSAPLAERLRALRLPFCVCTGYRREDLRPGFGDVLVVPKPVRASTLAGLLRSTADRLRSRP